MNLDSFGVARRIAQHMNSEEGKIRLVLGMVALMIVVVVLALIGTQSLGFYLVPSSSMEPTLLPDDRLVVYSSESYERGEVVVIRDPEDPEGYLVKRIVGLPGDKVEVRDHRLVLNEHPLQESYLKEPMDYRMDRIRVDEGTVFLFGDNRNNSDDSHLWKHGLPMNAIMGSVRYIYGPRERRGRLVPHTDVFEATQ